MMKILLTGHKGYIGAAAVPMLHSAGHTVVGFDTDLFEGCEFGDGLQSIPEIRKDIRDLTAPDLEGFDAVIHLAALSNDPLGNLNSDLTYSVNHRASVRLAQLAKQAGVKRFVFSSSCSTYGAAGDDFLDETAVLNPVTPYGESKVLAECEIRLLADSNFSPTFMRNATAYTTGRILIKSDGTPWRPITHICDIIAAMVAALEAPREVVHNETFNVGRTEENYRICELADIVAETIPGCRVEYAPGGGPDKRCYRVTCEKIRRVLPNFHPQWTARKGAEELYDAYRTIGLTAQDVECGRYIRIVQIQRLQRNRQLDKSLHWHE